ncbi:MAG: hypothetical protein KY469_12085 [Actinobacteria bacterium]|nr:hypothetical protein [Actinomycetota bacterium]
MISLGTLVSNIADLHDQLDAMPTEATERRQLAAQIADLEEVAARLMGGDPLTTIGFDGDALLRDRQSSRAELR